MKNIVSLVIILATASASFAGGFASGSFDLFDQPNAQLDGFCDRGTRLVLDEGGLLGKVAFLENFVHGSCEIAVFPQPRYYRITSVEDDGCGSTIYKGKAQDDRSGRTIEIVDNRGRLCENVIPALIVVTETSPQGSITMFSKDF